MIHGNIVFTMDVLFGCLRCLVQALRELGDHHRNIAGNGFGVSI